MAYPIYIASKGRTNKVLNSTGTSSILNELGINHTIVTPIDEVEIYEKEKWNTATILPCLESELKPERIQELCCNLLNHNITGSVPQRNSCQIYAQQSGAPAFWHYDDNCKALSAWLTAKEIEHYDCEEFMFKANERNLKTYNVSKFTFTTQKARKYTGIKRDRYVEITKKIFYDDFEPNLWKIDNMGIIGMNTVDAGPYIILNQLPHQFLWKVYSCYLMRTDYPLTFWGIGNEDVMLTEDAINHNYITFCSWRHTFEKPMTQSQKGGNTEIIYNGQKTKKNKEEWINSKEYIFSTYNKSKVLIDLLPQYNEFMIWKHRIHHHMLWNNMATPQIKIANPPKYSTKTSIDHLYPYIQEQLKEARAKVLKNKPWLENIEPDLIDDDMMNSFKFGEVKQKKATRR